MTKFASMRYVGLLAASALLFFASAADAKLAGNKLSSNSLPAAKADATILAANKLAASKLPPEGFLVHRYAANPAGVAGLIATDAGREVLTFIVSCALPEGTSLVATGPGDITYEFFGEIGLAKEWLHNALDNEGRGWMSACLFARTSGSHVPVPLSMRGQHRALALAPGEAETYTLEEGAYYGDYFTPDNESTACRGEDKFLLGNVGSLGERVCTETNPPDAALTVCGFRYAGACGDFAPAHACKHFSVHDAYRACHAQPIVSHDHSKRYQQVITIYVHD